MPEPSYLTRIAKNKHVRPFKNLTGMVFGELTVKSLSDHEDRFGNRYWMCVCSCGVEKAYRWNHLTTGLSRSCGNKSIHQAIPSEERFWKFVNKDGPIVRLELGPCWLWTGAINNQGYGNFNIDGPRGYAHRFSWTLRNGPIPDGLNVLHKCDNPPCVRPEHFFLGTMLDNMRDAQLKGRLGRKLTKEDVLYIRGSKEMSAFLALKYGVSQSHIWTVRKGKAWKHL